MEDKPLKNKEKETGYSADIKKNTRHVFWVFLILFTCLVIYLFKFMLVDSKKVIVNSYNPRLNLVKENIVRGDILDSKGNILASSSLTTASALEVREYPYNEVFSHLVGFSNYGKSGVEAKFNFHLESVNNEILQRIKNVFNKEPLKGNNIVLTLDADLQKLVHEKLAKQKGAIVVMEPSTGKILAMASYPNFNPNKISETWEELNTDEDNSPLLNRATQGLYPPGSIFKTLSTVAAFEKIPDLSDFVYECEGQAIFDGKRMPCFNSTVHGHLDVSKALTVSCNTFYAQLGMDIGGGVLREIADRAMFNTPYSFPLEYSRSSFTLKEDSLSSEIVDTYIGQGKTLVTPSHMAMITSAIANGGLMMEPYVLDSIVDNNGKQIKKFLPQNIAEVFTPEEAEFLTKAMILVVDEGTAKPARLDNVKIAAKTGTAQNASGDDHGWFIAFAPAENPEIVVSIVLENSGGPKKAIRIAREIIDFYLNTD